MDAPAASRRLFSKHETWPLRHETESQQDAEPTFGAAELRQYLAVCRKRWWIIAACVAVGVTLAVLHTNRKKIFYRATASVVIDPRPPQVLGSNVQEVVQLGTTGWSDRQYTDYYNTQVDIIKGYDLARITVVDNKLQDDPRLVPPIPNDTRTEDQKIEIAANAVAWSLSASQNRDSHIVNIHVAHENAELATMLANKHVATYIKHMLKLRTTGSDDATKFLAKELAANQAKLHESEERLYQFKKDNAVLSVSLDDKQNLLAKDIAKYTSALSDARIKRLELESVRNLAKTLKGEDILESPIFALSPSAKTLSPYNRTIADLKSQYSREKHRLAKMGEELGPRHPAYQSQKTQVADLLAAIEKEGRRAMKEINARHKTAVGTERRFEAEVARLKQDAFELGPKTVEYNRLRRQRDSDEKNYQLVVGRLRASELSGRNEAINVRSQAAARYAYPVGRRMKTNVILALMLSLMLGLGIAFVLEFLDRTVKSPEHIQEITGAPLLGVIPMVSSVRGETDAATRARDQFVFDNPNSPASECCRSVRTNILFSSPDKPMKTITVSSARPREGKTTSSIYLATTMAQSGQNVLLVDSDLRRPRLHKSMGVSRNVGLSNLIMGDASIEDALKTTDVPNLKILPAGPQPPNPAELLLANRFETVLDELKERFDFIVLDSPPLLAVTDAVILSRVSDGVLLVAQAGKTLTEDLAQSARLVRGVDVPILGVVLNSLDLTDRRYYYYAYAYGYGADAASEAS